MEEEAGAEGYPCVKTAESSNAWREREFVMAFYS